MSLVQKIIDWANANPEMVQAALNDWWGMSGKGTEEKPFATFNDVMEVAEFYRGKEFTLTTGEECEIAEYNDFECEHGDDIAFVINYRGKNYAKFTPYNSWGDERWDDDEFVPVEYKQIEIVTRRYINKWSPTDVDAN